MSSILLNIPEELKGVLSSFEYLSSDKVIKLQFSKSYQNKLVFNPFNLNDFVKSLKGLERKVKEIVSDITQSRYYLIENCIYQELDKLRQADDKTSNTTTNNNNKNERIQKIRKFDFGNRSYESILVNNDAHFISTPDIESETNDKKDYVLEERIELSDITLLPFDNVLTTNPLPYSFNSEEELNRYIEKAKNETLDSLFNKVFAEFKKYVNNAHHVLVVLSADIIYSYFQDKFGTTHYNIFIGENGSGKNSALLVFKYLGYRVFYVTAANAANYYTFLGDVQEGQGTIAEDEADDIGEDKTKQRILKTGYASGGTVPKIEFSQNGNRSQKPYFTFCHKWLAMEEIPDERKIRGVLDRSFIFKFLAGEVQYNIKDVEQDENSESYEKIQDLRKTLFVFKFLRQSDIFKDIDLSVKNRNAELTKPLLRLFNNTQAFEQIRQSLSVLIKEKSQLKSNSTEAKIFEALNNLISENHHENKDICQFTNEQVFEAVKRVMDGLENQYDGTYSTFITPDGLYVSKKKIKQILVSKFNAVNDKVNINGRTERVIRISKKWLEKLGKQYEIINEITVTETASDNKDDNGFCEGDTMTDLTLLENASPDFDKVNADTENRLAEYNDSADNNSKITKDECDGNPETKITNLNEDSQLKEQSETDTNVNLNPYPNSRLDHDNTSMEEKQVDETRIGPQDSSGQHGNSINQIQNNETYYTLKSSTISNNNQSEKFQDDKTHNNSINEDIIKDKQSTKNTENTEQAPPVTVTSVTSVTKRPFIYPCMFCSEYSTHIDLDMQLHLLEKHKKELLRLPIQGNLDKREDYVIAEIKKRIMNETSRILDADDL